MKCPLWRIGATSLYGKTGRVPAAPAEWLRRHAETSEPIPCPSLRAKRSNPGATVRPPGLLAPRILWPLDCFVARAPRNDGWVAADPIVSVVIGRRLSCDCLVVAPRLDTRVRGYDTCWRCRSRVGRRAVRNSQ